MNNIIQIFFDECKLSKRINLYDKQTNGYTLLQSNEEAYFK